MMRLSVLLFFATGGAAIGSFLIFIAYPALIRRSTFDNSGKPLIGGEAVKLGVARLILGIFMFGTSVTMALDALFN